MIFVKLPRIPSPAGRIRESPRIAKMRTVAKEAAVKAKEAKKALVSAEALRDDDRAQRASARQ